ncbi:MAG: hypothetical protein R3F59_39330, partial [Myxococcota bacterium]
VPHGRSARARNTLPPGFARATPMPAQRGAWVPGDAAALSGDGPVEGPAVDLDVDASADVDGAPQLLQRPEPPGPRRIPRPGTAEPPTAPPPRRAPAPGTGGPNLPRLGPMATPISPEHRTARYAQTAAETDVGVDPFDRLSTPLPAGRGAELDPARFVTPFLAYERQQAPARHARAVGAAPTSDPAASVASTAERVPPEADRAAEPDSPHGPPVDAVSHAEVTQDAAEAPVDAVVSPADPGGLAPPSREPAEAARAAAPSVPDVPDAPEVPELPTPHAHLAEKVRVQVDADLAVEVSTRGHRVDVHLSGAHEAVAPLRDLGPELDASLVASGFQLGSFGAEAQQQEGQRERAAGAEGDEARPAERQPTASRRPRFGRYA